MNYTIEIENLSKQYKYFLLNNINIKIPYGKIIGLIGENGAGKTTLISLILNQIKSDSGSIKVFGLDNIKNEKEIKKEIGFVVDESSFHDCLDVKNIKSIVQHIYPSFDHSYFDLLLEQFDVNENKRISQMSKGMKIKLMLAVALSHHPRLLILDEVTSGLDPVVRDDILQILREFVNNSDKSILFSTHITSDLEKIADDVAFLHKGNLIFFDSLQTIKQKFMVIKCQESDYIKIDKEDIITQYKNNDRYELLVYRNSISKYNSIAKEPTFDDIMLLYIKGEHFNDWLNQERFSTNCKEF